VSKPRVARRGHGETKGPGANANRSSFHLILSISSVNSSPATGHPSKRSALDQRCVNPLALTWAATTVLILVALVPLTPLPRLGACGSGKTADEGRQRDRDYCVSPDVFFIDASLQPKSGGYRPHVSPVWPRHEDWIKSRAGGDSVGI
jgi:hypothetical protein